MRKGIWERFCRKQVDLNFKGVGWEDEKLKRSKRKWQCLVPCSLEAEPEARIWVRVTY